MVLAAVWLLAYGAAGFRLASFRCPSCRERFLHRGRWYFGIYNPSRPKGSHRTDGMTRNLGTKWAPAQPPAVQSRRRTRQIAGYWLSQVRADDRSKGAAMRLRSRVSIPIIATAIQRSAIAGPTAAMKVNTAKMHATGSAIAIAATRTLRRRRKVRSMKTTRATIPTIPITLGRTAGFPPLTQRKELQPRAAIPVRPRVEALAMARRMLGGGRDSMCGVYTYLRSAGLSSGHRALADCPSTMKWGVTFHHRSEHHSYSVVYLRGSMAP